MKSLKKLVQVLIILLIGVLIGVLWQSMNIGNALAKRKTENGKVILMQRAPDGAHEAIVWTPELEGLGATVSQPYEVYIRRKGIPTSEAIVLVADKTDWIALSWWNNKTLLVCYSDAKIRQFSNIWQFIEHQNNEPSLDEIEIILARVKNKADCDMRLQ